MVVEQKSFLTQFGVGDIIYPEIDTSLTVSFSKSVN